MGNRATRLLGRHRIVRAARAGSRDCTPATVPARGIAALRPFRYRGFALLWAAGLVSNAGSWMQTVAVGALVISHTGKAAWAVLAAAGAFLPIGLLSPVGGALADRLPRRPMLAVGSLAEAAAAGLIAVLIATGHDAPVLVVVLVTAQGSVAALTVPFLQAILPDLVPQRDLLAAISLNSAQFNLGRIVGPALAGATVAAFGYPMAFVANSASFLAVVAVVGFLRVSPPAGAQAPLVASLRSGFAAARREESCWAATWTIAVVALLASPFIALVPAMARRLTDGAAHGLNHALAHGGSRAVAQTTALLTTAQGVGAVAGALCLASLAARVGRGRVLGGSLVLLPATLVAYAASPTRWWGAVTLFTVGMVYIGVLSGLSTLVQLRAPQAYRGRILSLFFVALGVAYPIGSLVQGPLADRIGIGWATSGAAVLLLVITMAVAAARPAVRRAITADAGPAGPPGAANMAAGDTPGEPDECCAPAG